MLDKLKNKVIKSLGGYTNEDRYYLEHKCATFEGLYRQVSARMQNRSRLCARYILDLNDRDAAPAHVIEHWLKCQLLEEAKEYIAVKEERDGHVAIYTAEMVVAVIDTRKL